jgi:hypothetical protein
MPRIIKYFAKTIAYISSNLKIKLDKFLYFISKTVTGAILVGGALAGLTTINGELQTGRVVLAGFAFIIGLPLGLVLFGASFNITIWLGIVSGILFICNLHNAWEVLFSLKYGGLDYVMTEQSVAAIESITPVKEDWKTLSKRISTIQENISHNILNFTQSNRILRKEIK